MYTKAMLVLLVFSFLAGIVTILSPCILPVLPIVLSGSLSGGKKRPLGIITGFILSFTFFTLFLSTLVRSTGISADSLRYLSIIIISFFGLSLLIPKLRVELEVLLSKLSSGAQKNPQTKDHPDFVAGVLVGLSLGLLWAPCVGPILASVISLALTGTVTLSAVFVTFAYSLGTAIPMLAITYGGRDLLNRAPWLLKNTGQIQKIFGVLMILTALSILLNLDRKFQTFVLTTFPSYGAGLIRFEENAFVQNALARLSVTAPNKTVLGKPMNEMLDDTLGTVPELIVGGQWFNTDPLTMESLRGKVVLIDFWTYTCINCIRTLPYIRNWHAKYQDKGLVIIGVHTPEFEFEKSSKNVQKAIEDFALPYPIMQDNDYATWRAYNNRYWPAKYLVDKDGKLRYTHFGEGDYDETEKMIQKLLEETGASIQVDVSNPQYRVFSRTPELYLGYERLAYFASPERIAPNKETSYSLPTRMPPNSLGYEGPWIVGGERAMPQKGATLRLSFDASEVFLVMRPKEGTSAEASVVLDGLVVDATLAGEDVVQGTVTVENDRLYKLIKLEAPGEHILELKFLDDNMELYAFTFG